MSDESNQNITISDQPAIKDTLGLEPYVIAVAEFLTQPKTKPPLTISIEGEWGSGKSSFMKQLEEQIIIHSEKLSQEAQKEACENKGSIYELFYAVLKPNRRPKIICFNAWRHDKAEALWAAFALEFLRQISTVKSHSLSEYFPTIRGHLLIRWKRFNWNEGWLDAVRTMMLLFIGGSAIILLCVMTVFRGSDWVDKISEQLIIFDCTSTSKSQMKESKKTEDKSSKPNKNAEKEELQKQINICIQKNLPSSSSEVTTSSSPNNRPNTNSPKNSNGNDIWKFLFGLGIGGSSLMTVVISIVKYLGKIIGDPKKDLTKYLKSPDYDSQVSFVEKFHADFKKIVEAYVGKDEKVYVFIDDLDRCELGKAADLLQALNMMISNDPQIIFILGMDREKVAAGITYKQKDVLPYLASIAGKNQDSKENNNLSKQLDYGFSYLEKFVQLSFELPRPSKNSLDGFFKGLSSNVNEIPRTLILDKINDVICGIEHIIDGGLINDIKYKLDDLKLEIGQKFHKLAPENKKLETDAEPEDDTKLEDNTESETVAKLENDTKLEAQKETKIERPELVIFPIIKKYLETQEKEDIAKMVAPFFDNNPRRLKNYINALRLKRYIYYYTIGVEWAERGKITQQQLGKFVAITIKHPRLLYELGNNDTLLDQLENYAIDKFNRSKGFNDSQNTKPTDNNHKNPDYGNAHYWVDTYPKLAELLCYEEDENNNPKCKISIPSLKYEYSLKNEWIKKLLEVSPKLELDPKYFKLREFLEANNWREADEETYKVMRIVAQQKNYPYLDEEAIKNFPCQDLHIIDQLWVKYSYGRFGFSVQKDIYQKLGCTREYNNIWLEFCDHIGWRKKGKWLEYGELTFTFIPTPERQSEKEVPASGDGTTSITTKETRASAPPDDGHFPTGMTRKGTPQYDLLIGGLRGSIGGLEWISSLASRLLKCNL